MAELERPEGDADQARRLKPEMGAKEPFAPPAGFAMLDERRYGKARLAFLTCGPRR